MSRKFLTNIDLNSNELLNGVIHRLNQDPETGVEGQIYFNTVDQTLKIYNGTLEEWQAVGSEEFIADAVANLIQAGNGISVDYDDPEHELTIANTGVLSVAGTSKQITVSASAGDVTIGLPDSVTIESTLNIGDPVIGGYASIDSESARFFVPLDVNSSADIESNLSVGASAYFADDLEVQGHVTIHGDLNVDGTLNAINRTEINLEDSSIRLNSNLSASATPVSNAELIVERGAESDVAIRWNESVDKWELTNDGTNYTAIVATNDLSEDIEDVVAGLIQGSNSLSVTYSDETDVLSLDTVLQSASPSYLLKSNGLAIDIPTLETKLISDSFTRKAAANVGNGVNVSFALVHNFDTRDVVVNVYDSVTYETVEVDVVRTDSNTVTVTFAQAPDASAYRVVIIG